MPRSQSRPKQKKSHHTIKQKPKNLKVEKAHYFSTTRSALSYDVKKSQFQNYSELGLLVDANQIGAAHDTIRGFKPRVKGPCRVTTADEDSNEPHPLELEVGEAAVTVRMVPDGECKMLRALLARHDDNYAVMARDMRINSHQHTAAHLRRRIMKMREQDAEDAAARDAAVVAETTAPKQRFRRKATKDPNPAFKKRSKNFI